LLEYVISLPVAMFNPKPYDRALFRNLCKGILPEKIRLQPKFNGAMTLAFSEFAMKKSLKELSSYTIANSLKMIDASNLDKLEGFERDLVHLKLLKMDYQIEKALPDGKE